MNKNKISKELLTDVSVLSETNRKKIFISTNNFVKTKQFLDLHKYSYTPYRFASCFCLNADIDDIVIFSNLVEVELIHSNTFVQTLSAEQDFINLTSLTENKHFGQGQTICFIDTGIHPHLDFLFPHSRMLKFVDF
ncbi:MAG: hypothetical protein IKY10_02925, partial [Clostridia bacterium]|nr:hypothetical protein [Clostridia bacterium]